MQAIGGHHAARDFTVLSSLRLKADEPRASAVGNETFVPLRRQQKDMLWTARLWENGDAMDANFV